MVELVGIRRCGNFRSGADREDRTIFWCAKTGSNMGCNGYSDGCPTPERYTPLTAGFSKHRYPEPSRNLHIGPAGSETRKVILLSVKTPKEKVL